MSCNNATPTRSSFSTSSSFPEKCLFSFRVINRVNGASCCLTCFCDSGLINQVQNFEIFITHHISNGPYNPWICVFCRGNSIQTRPAALCTVCMRALSYQQIKLRHRRINLSTTNFLYNNFTNKFEFIGGTLTRDDQ